MCYMHFQYRVSFCVISVGEQKAD